MWEGVVVTPCSAEKFAKNHLQKPSQMCDFKVKGIQFLMYLGQIIPKVALFAPVNRQSRNERTKKLPLPLSLLGLDWNPIALRPLRPPPPEASMRKGNFFILSYEREKKGWESKKDKKWFQKSCSGEAICLGGLRYNPSRDREREKEKETENGARNEEGFLFFPLFAEIDEFGRKWNYLFRGKLDWDLKK